MTNDLENNPQLQKMVEYAHKEGIHEKSAELSSLESFKLWLLNAYQKHGLSTNKALELIQNFGPALLEALKRLL